jgi:hypothetical protein
MKSHGLSRMTDAELVSQFSTIAKERGEATMMLDTRRANACFDRMKAVDLELRARGVETRKALIPLLNDRDRYVRYYAAMYLLGLVPDQARAILEWNTKYEVGILAADARGMLRALDEGTYKPD